MSPAFSVSAIPIGAVTIMVVHSCKQLRRDTPQAFRCCSIVGFDVPDWWGMQPTSVPDRSGSADGFVVRERVLVGFRVVRSGGDLVTPHCDYHWSHCSLLIVLRARCATWRQRGSLSLQLAHQSSDENH